MADVYDRKIHHIKPTKCPLHVTEFWELVLGNRCSHHASRTNLTT
jgi:hypothetical protein